MLCWLLHQQIFGEGKPTQAPANFELVKINDFKTATLHWDPVPLESLNGKFTFYAIQLWYDIDGHRNRWEEFVAQNTTQTEIGNLISVENRFYSGPKSDFLRIMPSSPHSIDRSLSAGFIGIFIEMDKTIADQWRIHWIPHLLWKCQ